MKYGHRRTVHRSVGDRKQLLAGRLSDKMSSELGYYRNVIGELCFLARRKSMIFELVPITEADLPQYKADMQEAIQKGFEEDFGKSGSA